MAKENSGDEVLNEGASTEDNIDDISWDDVSEDTGQTADGSKPGTESGATTQPQKQAEFSELKKTGITTAPKNLDFILDIPLEVTVELGRTSLPIFDLLQLGQGSIVELSKLAGEPLEILVNGKLIAKGEVVVINEKFGIRLTDVVSPQERVEKLG